MRHKPSAEVLQAVLELYEKGKSIDALAVAEGGGPIRNWTGVEACVLGARLAANTGAPRLSSRLSIRAWREDNKHPAGQLQFAYEFCSRRGPLELWWTMREWPEAKSPSPVQEAELLALRGAVAADLRDFALAEELLDEAESLAPTQPWVHLQRAHLLEREDCVEQALEVTVAACALHPQPYYRPAVQNRAHLLQLLDRDDEAIELLFQAITVLQNAPVTAQLFLLLAENGRWEESELALQRFVSSSPLLEPAMETWVHGQRSRVAYRLGKREEACRFASALNDEFHKGFCRALKTTPVEPERVHLDVTFVRQHFKTCAPATLAALGRFWRMPHEHLKLAEAMCYDGTPLWQQREWAENNGWHVSEFQVTEESAMALLTRAIPFAICTVEATCSHMQAVVGFDRTRGTLFLRDPGQPYLSEVPVEAFLQRYRAFGPRGCVFLPVAERARLEGLSLPDADVYDHYHEFCLNLAKHQRAGAEEVLSRMQGGLPNHQLTWEARLDLASYDANPLEQARCLDELLKLHPNNPARLLRRLGCMSDAPWEERVAFLSQYATGNADPALLVEMARTLQGDARRTRTARYWLRRAFRQRPMDSGAITARADLYWQDGKLDEATELYRFAANLEGFKEGLFKAWFLACRRTRRTQQAIAHLEDRCRRFGERSGDPATTLAWAWRELERPAEAREVLAAAIRLRPDDGTLLMRAACLHATPGESAEAERLLNLAKSKTRANDWLRAAAECAENRLDSEAALGLYREILKREPLALDAHNGIARLLARREGNAAAWAYLAAARDQFPHHYGLQRMLVEWSRHSNPAVAEAAIRELLRVTANDSWARRELAIVLSNLGRHEEALREAGEAAQIEPRNTFSFSVLGGILSRAQRFDEARVELRRAIEFSVDNGGAIHALLELAQTDKERREELEFIERQLMKQVVHGEGLLAFLDLARPILEPEKLLRSLRAAHAERPDLWHAWSALVSQLTHLGDTNEAQTLAQQAVEKFPHLPRIWLDLAWVYRAANDFDRETKAAEHAFEMNPGWSRATVALASALERCGKMEEARRIYERALQHSANDPELHAAYAHLLWRQRQMENAFGAIQQALRLAPGYDWAWNLLSGWANESGKPERVVGFARSLTRERPGEVPAWLMLARSLNDREALPERLAALEKALGLDATIAEVWDLKAELLTDIGRFDEAIQSCEQGASTCKTNAHLVRGRRAWIEAQRRQFPEAVRLMRLVLAENAGYAWGWNQLAHWLMQQDALTDAAAAFEQLLRLRPQDAWVHRQLGFLRLKQNDDKGAVKAFRTALQLAPADVFAAQNVVELQLQSGDVAGATATLRLMETHQPGARTQACEALLLLRKGDKEAADTAFEKLCNLPDPDPWPVETVVVAFQRANRRRQALRILRRSLKAPTCNPQVAAVAIGLLLDQHEGVLAVWLFLRLKPGEIQRRAAAPLIQGLANLKRRRLFDFVFWRRRDILARDDAAWGQVGYALSSQNRMQKVSRWLADWPSRHNVEPWMLFNLCLALRDQARYAEANALARQVLERWGYQKGFADIRLFIAVEAALAGEKDQASQHLRQVVVRPQVAYDRQLKALAQALVDFQQSPTSQRSKSFRAVRHELAQHFSSLRLAKVGRDVRRTFKRSANVFVREGGGWRARLWFIWKLTLQ